MTDQTGQTRSNEAGSAMLDHALEYLERGYPIFPVCSPAMGTHKHWDGQKMATCPSDRRGKLPLVKWKTHQTELPTELEIRSSWARWPLANIGMATGTLSNIIVLDCDSGDAKRQAMENGGLSETPAVFTGKPGGIHFWLAHPGRPVSNFARRRPGLDFRGDGGYVLLPPSHHVSGATYRWVPGTETLPPAPIPPWLDELLSEPGEAGSHDPLDLTAILNGVPDGERDVIIFRFACKMRGDDVERRYAEMIVSQAALACRPPFPVERALAKVAWAYEKYEPNATFTVGEDVRTGADDAPQVEARTLDDVLATFRHWLHFNDDRPVLTFLAAIAANLLPGDPLWLMLVGASSSGKTELIMAARQLDMVHLTAELTAPALLSATPKRDVGRGATGGLLRQVGEIGILIAKDFTTVLAMKHDARATVLAALREIYDGSWTRHVGVDGGRMLRWEGKLGLITGCTTAIDTHHAVMAAMGERFILCRLPEIGRQQQARQALRNRGQERRMRAELAAAVAGLFAGLGLSSSAAVPALSDQEADRLTALADVAARARSGVDRDRASHEIELVHDVEAPARLVQALSRLYTGLLAIGVQHGTAWELVRSVGMDCLPKLRRAILDLFIRHVPSTAPLTTTAVATAIGHPTITTRRVLEDLNAHHVLDRIDPGGGRAHLWTLTDETRSLLAALT